ncbi:MAG: hypothetical protein EXR62_03400 [Chloroflexi bacterium]|nr:hypothetical protein [Chloroflexota bacterium]
MAQIPEQKPTPSSLHWKKQFDVGPSATLTSPFSYIAYGLLLLLGVLALLGIGITAANYLSSIASAQGLGLQLGEVQISQTGPARARLQFKVHNGSSQGVRIEAYEAFLFLKGRLVTNSYAGIEPGANAADFRNSLIFTKELAPAQSLDLDLTLYIPADQAERARETLSASTVTWSANVLLRVHFPNTSEARWLRLTSRFPE